jgi:hypothetical protein
MTTDWSSSNDWRPPVGATVQLPTGGAFEVVGRFEDVGFGDYIVLKQGIPGGWKTRLVTHGQWLRDGFVIVR